MILVTGSGGLLGANFVLTALHRQREVAATFHRNAIRIPGVSALPLDITDRDSVERVIASLEPEWIVHCAAVTNVDWCEDHPAECHSVNEEATRTLARAARDHGSSMTYISTDAVYRGSDGNYDEGSPADPVNVYGRSKLAGENAVREVLGDPLILRTNIFGWNLQPKHSIAEWFLSGLEAGKRVPGFTDVLFSPLLVNSLSEIILDLMDARKTGTFNAGCVRPCSKYEFGRMLAETFHLDPGWVQPVRLADTHLRAPRPLDTSLDTRKISHALGRGMPDVGSQLARFKYLRDSGFAGELRDSWGGS
ncbi:MAG TPA: SDR family oxidoreductase [Methanomicrobiales archaeon]|nr:SDR family oxidoreductase [Methanomicrobiales archaeon]